MIILPVKTAPNNMLSREEVVKAIKEILEQSINDHNLMVAYLNDLLSHLTE
jgi:hypothetical protein